MGIIMRTAIQTTPVNDNLVITTLRLIFDQLTAFELLLNFANSGWTKNDTQELPDRAMGLKRVSQVPFQINQVRVSPPILDDGQHAGFFQVGDDSESCSFSHSDPARHFHQSHSWVVRQAHQNVNIVTKVGPVIFVPAH